VESAVFFQEIVDDLLLVTIDPAGNHGDADLQNHSDFWGCKRQPTRPPDCTANPQKFSEIASTDFFNHSLSATTPLTANAAVDENPRDD
jgi:hypothetical protein